MSASPTFPTSVPLEIEPPLESGPRPKLACSAGVSAFVIALGCLLSLTITGYQIGQSNHTVYLLDGIRHADPDLFSKDWFVNGTLQYHGLFSYVTRYAIKFGILNPVFLMGYLATVLGFHYWIYRLVRVGLRGAVGAENKTALGVGVVYLLTVVLYHLSAGGTGLGGFQFLQDSAFLPSNVSNVAMLAGIVLLMEARIWAAAVALGLSGIFHINHAVFAPFVFAAGAIAIPGFARAWKTRVLAGFVVGLLCLVNVGPSMLHLSQEQGAAPLPLAEFVQIYAKLRHPHHYYPRAWHPMVYVGALWTFVPTALLLLKGGWRLPTTARRVGLAVAIFLNAAAIFALVFAGVVYVSERLIQMAVFRFTIYPILLSCAVCAWGLCDPGVVKRKWTNLGVWALAIGLVLGVGLAWSGVVGEVAEAFVKHRPAPFAFAALLVAAMALLTQFREREPKTGVMAASAGGILVVLIAAWNLGWLGLNFLQVYPPAYTRLAEWCKTNTPKDAMFIVPPNDQAFRLSAERSIFINFKAIPQTAREMPEWKRRMQLVTGVQNLPGIASTFNEVLQKLGEVYAARPESDMVGLARAEGARYILTTATYSNLKLVGPEDTAPYRLYDLAGETPTTQPKP